MHIVPIITPSSTEQKPGCNLQSARWSFSNPFLRLALQGVYLMANPEHTTSWPDLAIGLYDRLIGRNA
jgi:hypothetical protein